MSKFFFSIMIFCTYLLSAKQYKVIEDFSKHNSYLLKLEDEQGKYILKQTKGGNEKTFINVVLERFGTIISKEAGVECNGVTIISKDKCKKIKPYENRPATLHVFIEGEKMKYVEEFQKAQLKQDSRYVKIKGFTREMIKDMSQHPYFSKIVALDAFIGNRDRHRGNILIDSNKNFYAIDFGAILSVNLFEVAQKNLKSIDRHGFSPNEIEALKIYRDTLDKLYSRYSYDSLVSLFDECINETGFTDIELQEGKTKHLITHYKNFIHKSYKSGKEYLKKLNKFIQSIENERTIANQPTIENQGTFEKEGSSIVS